MWLAQGSARCLPGVAHEPWEQQNISISGMSMPIGIWVLDWASAKIYSALAQIILEEVLMYNVSLHGPGCCSPTAIWALSGCKDGVECYTDPPVSEKHLVFEAWSLSTLAGIEHAMARFPLVAPINLGSVGYRGLEEPFLQRQIISEEFDRSGNGLDFYRGFNASWYSPAEQFTDHRIIDTSRLTRCNQSFTMSDHSKVRAYRNNFPNDPDGVEEYIFEEHGQFERRTRARCPDGYRWLSPACRADVSKCVPFLTTDAGWGADYMMQRANMHNMPVAIMMAKDWDEFVKLNKELKTVFDWWVPDVTFVHDDVTQLLLPPHNREQWRQELKVTSSSHAECEKWAHPQLESAAPPAFKLASRMNLNFQTMESLLRQATTGMSSYDVACTFLRTDKRWEDWVPKRTSCSEGWGIADRNGNLVDNLDSAFMCVVCQAGKFSALSSSYSSRLCLDCDAGFISEKAGATECTPCNPGSIRPSTQKDGTSCELCEEGRYQAESGRSHCEDCSANLSGSVSPRGSRSVQECVCPESSMHRFLDVAEGEGAQAANVQRIQGGCVACPQGLTCFGSSSQPFQQAGFWAEATASEEGSYSVFKCRSTQECPVGPLSSCAQGRRGRACSTCAPNHFPTGDGICKVCTRGDFVPAAIAALGLCLMFAGLAVFTRQDRAKQTLGALTTYMIIGQFVTVLQILSSINQLSFVWIEPLKTVMSLLSLISFEWPFHLKLACLLGDGPIGDYVLKLCTYPACFAALLTAFFVCKCLGRPIAYFKAFNLNGMMLMVLYITLSLTVLLPFKCHANPNGEPSLSTNPGTICWTAGEHMTLVLLGVGGILVYIVGIYTWIAWATWMYPARISSIDGILMVNCYSFLFHRFRPDAFYFGVIYLTRNAMVALLPVVLATVPTLHVFAMGSLLLLSLTVQIVLVPWRTSTANRVDGTMFEFLVLIMLAVGPLLDTDQEDAGSLSSMLAFLLIMALLVFALACIGVTLYKRYRPDSRYDLFFCHHKKAACSLARFMKTLLRQQAKVKVFLDSDDLQYLDKTLDVIRSQTTNLLVIATSEVLVRPWCLAEMAVAHLMNVPIVVLESDGSNFLPDDLEEAARSLNEEHRFLFMTAEIPDGMVKNTLRSLLACSTIRLNVFGSWVEHEEAAGRILDCCNIERSPLAHLRAETTFGMRLEGNREIVAIVGVAQDAEGLAMSRIIKLLLQRNLQAEVGIVRSPSTIMQNDSSARHVLLLLHRGILQDPGTVACLLLLSRCALAKGKDLTVLTLRVDAMFEMPGSAFYDQLARSGHGPGDVDLLSTVAALDILPVADAAPQVAALYRSIFCVVALPFSPDGSETLQEQQIRALSEQVVALESKRKFLGTVSLTQLSHLDLSFTSKSSSPRNYQHGADTTDTVEEGVEEGQSSSHTNAIMEAARDSFDDIPESEGLRGIIYRHAF
eukprot:TRINITY_DN28607_c1_g1_i1.p1 TRINITY_DN28607_c1_g1~~TRINITY_DN28607_c1_g1_i1.p1  ORF type:complete len:1454 (-),score=224.85 TRINITY_DN28607_c1_g1_i1:90-4385(-)